VGRLIVLVDSPYHLRPAEAEEWLRCGARGLANADGVEHAVLSKLTSPSDDSARHWSWLIEVECESPDGAQRAVDDSVWKDVLGDMRLLGMRPRTSLVAESRALHG
jgi:hypothetical protein